MRARLEKTILEKAILEMEEKEDEFIWERTFPMDSKRGKAQRLLYGLHINKRKGRHININLIFV